MRTLNDESAQGLLEYVLVIAFVSVALVAALSPIAVRLSNLVALAVSALQ